MYDREDTMGTIIILDEKTTNQIAAGEVIERPASVVKEMVENSIDAGADQITVEIRKGGIQYIRVTDNGSGIENDDAEMAFEKHATSKIRKIEDLDRLSSMGFRGEALSSIAAVSSVELITKTANASIGTYMKAEGGQVVSISQTGCPKGTSLIVRNLFYNTPARYKFLKKDTTEAGYVSDIIERMALSHPGISFKFIQDGQERLHTPGNNDLLSTIYSIYGKDIAKSVLSVKYENNGVKVAGFIGRPEIARGNRSRQSIFINCRYIKSPMIVKAMEEAYQTLLMNNKFPFCVLTVTVPPESFDVNVHPQKLEVRFSDEKAVYSAVYHGVKNTLLNTSLIQTIEHKGDYGPASDISTKKEIQATEYVVPGTKQPNTVKTDQDGFIRTSKNADNKNRAEDRIDLARKSIIDKSGAAIKDKSMDFKVNNIVYESVDEVKHEKEGADVNNDYHPVQEFNLFHQDTCSADSRNSAIQSLKEAKIVGQAFNTYILLQNGDYLYIIDQHAAHERIQYEELKKRLLEGENYSQGILEPLIIKLSAHEFNFVMDKQQIFRKLGFDLEAFGINTIILRSVPDFYDECSFSLSDFHGILDSWMQNSAKKSGISDEVINMMACKGAIKANRPLLEQEIHGLVESLCKMENPWTCVHGRPVIIKIEKKEFEKKFKRII
jgi:DNA mismatch repair protein MutL